MLVTGATGSVGSSAVEHLLGTDQDVIAAIRAPTDVRRVAEGARTRLFDFGGTPDQLDSALEGVDRLFLMRPPQIDDVRTFLFPLIDAAKRRAVRQIVFLSLQGVQANRSTPHHRVEAYLKQVGAPYTFLRPNFFMQNLSGTYRDDIRNRNVISIPAGRALTAFIDARDVGRVAASVLTEPGHLQKAYTLSGEHSLSYQQVARIMTEVLGREILYDRPREADYLARLARDGAPEDYIAVQKMIYRIVRLNISALPNHAVRKVTGKPATSFRQFVVDHRAAWE